MVSAAVIKYFYHRDTLHFTFHFNHNAFKESHMSRFAALNEDINRRRCNMKKEAKKMKLSILISNACREDNLKIKAGIEMIESQAKIHSECQ